MPVTPGQNWEAKDLSVHQFVSAVRQKNKIDANNSILEPNFKNKFQLKDIAQDMHKRNV